MDQIAGVTSTCWYVDGGTPHVGTLVNVSAGDTVYGWVTATANSGTRYSYTCHFKVGTSTGTVTTTDYYVHGIPEMDEAANTLEARGLWGVAQCSDYPATLSGTTFSAVKVTLASGSPPSSPWTVDDAITDCNQSTSIVNNSGSSGVVTIYYNNYTSISSATITGPTLVAQYIQCSWNASVSGGSPPYIFSWTAPYVTQVDTVFGTTDSFGYLATDYTFGVSLTVTQAWDASYGSDYVGVSGSGYGCGY